MQEIADKEKKTLIIQEWEKEVVVLFVMKKDTKKLIVHKEEEDLLKEMIMIEEVQDLRFLEAI